MQVEVCEVSHDTLHGYACHMCVPVCVAWIMDMCVYRIIVWNLVLVALHFHTKTRLQYNYQATGDCEGTPTCNDHPKLHAN